MMATRILTVNEYSVSALGYILGYTAPLSAFPILWGAVEILHHEVADLTLRHRAGRGIGCHGCHAFVEFGA